MPREDEAITSLHRPYLDQFHRPKKLSDVVTALGPDSDYVGIFIPGGHGALIGLPGNEDVAATIRWAMANDRYVISLCHGPAAFLANEKDPGGSPLKGYSICAFPDAVDRQTPDIGYMPGHLTWYFGEKLKALGIKIVKEGVTGATHSDRKVITGDSPFAANALGKLAAKTLLEGIAKK